MTLKQLIDMVDDLKPNAFTNDTKTAWVNEVEGLVQTEVMLLDISTVVTYVYSSDQSTELLVAAPHNKLYRTYLAAMIDFANGEYDKYQNSVDRFNRDYTEYTRWYAERYNPIDGRAEVQGYYISAYAIAVKHGYIGTEEEWLETLKGEGPPAGIIEATLDADSWVNHTQEISDTKLVTEGYLYIVSPASSSASAYAYSRVVASDVTVTGKMSFTCSVDPTDDLTVRIVRIEVDDGSDD